MSLPITKRWMCEIQSERLKLQCDKRVVAIEERQGDEPLEHLLNRMLGQRGFAISWLDTLSIRLDIDAVHYLTVPWQAGIHSPQELRCYGTSLALTAWPELAKHGVRLAFVSAEYGQSALAAVLNESLWQTLKAVAKHHKLRLAGVFSPLQYLLPAVRNLPDNVIYSLRNNRTAVHIHRENAQWQRVFCLNHGELTNEQDQIRLGARLLNIRKETQHIYLNTDNGDINVLQPSINL